MEISSKTKLKDTKLKEKKMVNELPAPNPPATNNVEAYLAMLAGVTGLPMPETINNNVEYYLRYLVEHGGGGGGGTSDYNQLSNLPTLNGHTIEGTMTSPDLDIIPNDVVAAFWHGTEAQYDAIATKDAKTLYLIEEE
jgi:hypothetical protein